MTNTQYTTGVLYCHSVMNRVCVLALERKKITFTTYNDDDDADERRTAYALDNSGRRTWLLLFEYIIIIKMVKRRRFWDIVVHREPVYPYVMWVIRCLIYYIIIIIEREPTFDLHPGAG